MTAKKLILKENGKVVNVDIKLEAKPDAISGIYVLNVEDPNGKKVSLYLAVGMKSKTIGVSTFHFDEVNVYNMEGKKITDDTINSETLGVYRNIRIR